MSLGCIWIIEPRVSSNVVNILVFKKVLTYGIYNIVQIIFRYCFQKVITSIVTNTILEIYYSITDINQIFSIISLFLVFISNEKIRFIYYIMYMLYAPHHDDDIKQINKIHQVYKYTLKERLEESLISQLSKLAFQKATFIKEVDLKFRRKSRVLTSIPCV